MDKGGCYLALVLIILAILYSIGFTFGASILIFLLLIGIVVFLAWLAHSQVVRRWHVLVFLIVCFLGNRSCSYVVSQRQLHQSLVVIPGVTVKAILSPDNFPSIDDLDETQFDVASDASLLFRKNDQLIACTSSDGEQSIAVLAEVPGLRSFVLDSEGSLLTMSRGVLGQYTPPESQISVTSWPGHEPQIDLAQVVPEPGPGGRPVGPIGPNGGGPYHPLGGGGGAPAGSARITVYDAFHWFFLPPSDLVAENTSSPPPPLSDGACNYTLTLAEPPRLPRYPQPLQLLPDPEMHLARGDKAGQVLVFGGQNSVLARELHRVYSDGSAQWVVNAAKPIRFAAENHGQLYIVTYDGPESDSEARHWAIIHLPLGTKDINEPELVFKSDQLLQDTRIQSFALSESGKTLFFSVPNRVYAIHGPLVVKIVDGISGILRTHGDTLYVFNARRKALLAITGI